MNFYTSAALFSASVLLTACATPTVVERRQTADSNLSCTQLAIEISKANEFEQKARSERGVTGTNVAATLFFLPGLVFTYMNTDEAITAAKDRQAHLQALSDKANCKDETQAPAKSKLVANLNELKKSYDAGVLTTEEFEAAKKKLIAE